MDPRSDRKTNLSPGQWVRYRLARLLLGLLGWQVKGEMADCTSCVMISTHTTNWDFVISACLIMVLSRGLATATPAWLGKKEAFRGPLGAIFRSLGGIPIDRSGGQGIVEQAVQAFAGHDNLVMGIMPKGTRKSRPYWRTGFYHIAQGAGVPIACVYMDYKRKVAGIGPLIVPSGDLEADLGLIREFYRSVHPKHPERRDVIQLRPDPPVC
jgi:1-acyl-sn-glycerol-3-phosphate acyltransferase